MYRIFKISIFSKLSINEAWAALTHLFWVKTRVAYYMNNWIYTTNHKRIAVNYFWFVILSGIVGMVLATLIRLEFAYPGAGVFVGDSLQYLSLATAHGVIMVFFMIMPPTFRSFRKLFITDATRSTRRSLSASKQRSLLIFTRRTAYALPISLRRQTVPTHELF